MRHWAAVPFFFFRVSDERNRKQIRYGRGRFGGRALRVRKIHPPKSKRGCEMKIPTLLKAIVPVVLGVIVAGFAMNALADNELVAKARNGFK
jgi:hypothetical protein